MKKKGKMCWKGDNATVEKPRADFEKTKTLCRDWSDGCLLLHPRDCLWGISESSIFIYTAMDDHNRYYLASSWAMEPQGQWHGLNGALPNHF